MSKKSEYIFVFLLVLFAINFFNLRSLYGTFVRPIQFGYLLLAIILSIPYLFPKIEAFVLPVQLIFFSVLFSIVVSTVTWGQSLNECITGALPVLVFGFFFYLKHIKFPIDKIENIIVVYGIVYLILYFFQFTHATNDYFIDPEKIDLNRGIIRILFPGAGVFYLTTFIALNKFTSQKGNRWFWAILLIMGLVVTVMQVTKQIIIGTVLIYIFHFLQGQGPFKKLIIMGSIGIMLYFVFQFDNPIVKGLVGSQNETLNEGSDYVRLKAATFFLTDYSNSNINRIFGNGVPYGMSSKYSWFQMHNELNYGYFLSDVGLIAVYVMFGIFAVVGYILIFIKSFIIKLPENYFYLKYYLWLLLCSCLTSDSVFGSGTVITTVYVIYMYQRVYEEEKYETMDIPESTP